MSLFALFIAPALASAGVAERHFELVWNQYDELLRRCMASRSCVAAPADMELLAGLLSAFSEEHRMGGLRLESGKRAPDLFRRNGEGPVRVLNTRPEVGAPIFVNRDMIYTPAPGAAMYSPLPISEALRLLMIELAYHQRWDEGSAGRIANKASALLESLTERIFQTRYSLNPITITLIAADSRNRQKATLLLSDDAELYDLGPALWQSSPCRDVAGVTLRNLAWEPVPPFDGQRGVQPMDFTADANLVCDSAIGATRVRGRLEFRRNDTGKRLFYVPGSASFEW